MTAEKLMGGWDPLMKIKLSHFVDDMQYVAVDTKLLAVLLLAIYETQC